ncbi:MAG: hypothetical protein D3904_13935 [Candidatus Electrothrix sp. EH2]|nr:hypothetical protein [Candidatus Electrothrix sp. EH2]
MPKLILYFYPFYFSILIYLLKAAKDVRKKVLSVIFFAKMYTQSVFVRLTVADRTTENVRIGKNRTSTIIAGLSGNKKNLLKTKTSC